MTQRTLERGRRKRAEELDDEVLDAQASDAGDDGSHAQSAKKGRATPGRRNQEAEEQGNIFVRTWRSIREYFSEVRDELTKVTWPTREEVIKLARIVLSALLVSSIAMGLISLGMGETIRIGLDNPVVLVVILVAAVGAAVWSQQRSAGAK